MGYLSLIAENESEIFSIGIQIQFNALNKMH